MSWNCKQTAETPWKEIWKVEHALAFGVRILKHLGLWALNKASQSKNN